MTADQDRAAVYAEMEQARRDFRDLLAQADSASLRRQSDGTRWTNQQLLFHMLFGYLIVRALLVLAGLFWLAAPCREPGVRAPAGRRAHTIPPGQLPGILRRRADHPGSPDAGDA